MEFAGFDKSFGLTNRVCLVTGGAAGIGRAIAILFLEKGAKLVLADVNATVAAIAQEICPDRDRVHTVVADLTQSDDRDRAVEAGLERFGRIDILINNAGIVLLDDALRLSEDYWDRTMAINLRAPFFLAQRVAREMIKTGGGKIVNVASQAGLIALDKHAAYCAGKAAIISMTKVLALEWARYNIQINAISPTVVLTELGRKAWAGEVGEQMKKKIPNGRFAYPEEIAACALFLASDAATMINGENLVIDGGYTIQ
ncbi:MAG: D-threitol dehydrogenase [Verrucomicrobia bacterium]|nr:D-threitol dehydrogenase [Verrucomicrobiota bacterium]